MLSRVVRQISVKSGVRTALYDKSIKLGMLILDIMRSIFKIRGNRYALCQLGEGGNSSGGNSPKWPPPAILLWCGNIQQNWLKQFLIVMIYLTKFKDCNHAIMRMNENGKLKT